MSAIKRPSSPSLSSYDRSRIRSVPRFSNENNITKYQSDQSLFHLPNLCLRNSKMDCGGPYSCKQIRAFVEHPHVFLVDDCEITRKLIELLFNECSCRVTTSDGGLNALEYLGLADDDQSSGDYNTPKMKMICIDYDMPVMNGYELLKKLKESPLMEDVPIAVMASDNDPTLVKKCIEAGAVMFISKPVKEADVEKLKTLMK